MNERNDLVAISNSFEPIREMSRPKRRGALEKFIASGYPRINASSSKISLIQVASLSIRLAWNFEV